MRTRYGCGLLLCLALLCSGCSERQKAIWRQAEREYYAGQRAYAATPHTTTTCRQSCLFQVCSWSCETY